MMIKKLNLKEEEDIREECRDWVKKIIWKKEEDIRGEGRDGVKKN